jgi:outer membrane protein
MKQLLVLTICLLFAFSNINAQMNSGSRFISGNNSFSFHGSNYKQKDATTDPDKFFNLNLTTKAGYFIKNRIAVGAMIDYIVSKQNNVASQFKHSNSSFLIGPLARYYMEYGKLVPFAEVSVGLGTNIRKDELTGSTSTKTKSPVFAFNAGVGANYFINERIALEGVLAYTLTQTKFKSAVLPTAVYYENALGATFGIIFYFGTI